MASLNFIAFIKNNGINLIVIDIIRAKFLMLILKIFNGSNSFSSPRTRSLIVVENVKIAEIIINSVNLHIVKIPIFNFSFENKKYIRKINKKIKRNGLKFLKTAFIEILEIIEIIKANQVI